MNDAANFSAGATRALLGACALALGRRIDAWSLALAVLALACLWWAAQLAVALLPQACLLLSVLVGGMQKALALRTEFDEAVFRDWAVRWEAAAAAGNGDAASEITADLLAFDRALAASGLRPVPGGSPRDLDSRLFGARKLLGRQLIAFAAQFVALLVAVAAMHLQLAG